MPEPFLILDSITKLFGGVKSLVDVSVSFAAGEVVGLAGENGSGKSTLVKILAGVHAATSGTVSIDGRTYAKLKPMDTVAAGIQIIYQDFSLFPNLSVMENIAFSNQLSGGRRFVRTQEMRRVAIAALERLKVKVDLNALVERLPVADKQLVAIARALVNDARLIVMDEPTTALTENEVKILLGIIARLKASGVSVIFVSHKLQEVLGVCDRMIVLRNGRKVAEGPIAEFDAASLAYHITGRKMPEPTHRPKASQFSEELLRVDNLCRAGHFENVSFSLSAGEVVGIAGLLGSGRTELANAVFGLVPVDRGEIRVGGVLVRMSSPRVAIEHKIGYVPEDRLTEGLFLDRSIVANVESGSLDRYAGFGGVLKHEALGKLASSWLTRLKVKGPYERPVQTLSGGNQQRVVLARWLSREPKIVILNGPTVGVDVGSKAEIHDVIGEFSKQGIGTLIVSDDLAELLICCNRILVMKAGSVVRELPNRDLREAELAHVIAQ